MAYLTKDKPHKLTVALNQLAETRKQLTIDISKREKRLLKKIDNP